MKIGYILFCILLAVSLVSAADPDTGDTGFYDTGYEETEYEETISEQEVRYLLSEGRGDELTADMIAEHIDIIDDLTQLDSYELNKYIQQTYGSELNIEDAVPGTQLTSDGYLTNGEYGSKINLGNIPSNSQILLEEDGSITIYPQTNEELAIDYELLIEENNKDDIQRPAITIVSTSVNYEFADGTILSKDSILILEQEGILTLKGTVDYKGLEISSSTGTIVIVDSGDEQADFEEIRKKIQDISHTGHVIIDSDTIGVVDNAQVIVRENEQYKVGKDQGLIFASKKNGGIVYDVSEETPLLQMYGSATGVNGLRLMEVTPTGGFYSFRGGWRYKEAKKLFGEELIDIYNEKLIDIYGFTPKKTIDMDIVIYEQGKFEEPLEAYELRYDTKLKSEELDSLKAEDLYVANYFFSSNYQTIPKKKAVILWSYGEEDKEDFEKVVAAKKQDLLGSGYQEDQIEIKYFDDDIEFFQTLNSLEDVSYLDIVGHGWVFPQEGGKIGAHKFYSEQESTYAVSSTEITKYFELRNAGYSDAEIVMYFKNKQAEELGLPQQSMPEEEKPLGNLFSEEGAICTISTCHSAAQYSVYDPEYGLRAVMPKEAPAPPIAQAMKQAIGEDATVYGTIGPLYIAKKLDEKGNIIAQTFVPVVDTIALMEGTQQPSAETIYSQDIPYFEIE